MPDATDMTAGTLAHSLGSGKLVAPDDVVLAFRDRATRDGLVDVSYCVIDTPIAPLTVAATAQGLLATSYAAPDDLLPTVSRTVSPRILETRGPFDELHRQLDDYFGGKRRDFTLDMDWSLVRSPFGRAVLEAAQQIRYGDRSTYQRLAEQTGRPAASRAVGNALGANPLCIVVPCHRVVRSGGGLGGYAGGLDRKAALLDLEAGLTSDRG